MKDRDDRAAIMLRQLGNSGVPLERAEQVAARRARLVPALSAFADAEMGKASRRPRGRRTLALGAAVAALTLGIAAFFVLRHGPPEPTLQAKEGTVRVLHGGSELGARVPQALAAADLLETLDGTAEVNLVTGAVVDLGEQSRIELTAVERRAGTVSERVRLSSGRVSVRVPKLPQGSELSIGTPDATVTVHGTAFTVEVKKTEGGALATTVVVTEGRVAVDSGERHMLLGPGSHWTSAPRAPDTAPAIPTAAPSSAVPAASASAASASVASRRSTLGTENELFRAALAADRAGNEERTLALVERLLRSYPDTPLGGEARALQAQARQKLGRGATP